MHFLVVADPLESFKIAKDSTFAMLREAQQRGHRLSACTPQVLSWRQGGRVQAYVRDIVLTGQATDWFAVQAERVAVLADFDAVLMRKDPPFDSEYFYATHLLEQAEREGARVFNRPRALRDHPEKLSVMEFPQFLGPTLVTRSSQEIRQFHAEHGDIILKPLDGMGGMGVFRVGPDGLNLGSIIETLNRDGAQSVMVQKFLPAIAQGDGIHVADIDQPRLVALARHGDHKVAAPGEFFELCNLHGIEYRMAQLRQPFLNQRFDIAFNLALIRTWVGTVDPHEPLRKPPSKICINHRHLTDS